MQSSRYERMASALAHMRQCRAEALGKDIMYGPAWDILVELYSMPIPRPSESLSQTLQTSAGLTKRWLAILHDRLLVTDGPGGRFELTNSGRKVVERVMELACPSEP